MGKNYFNASNTLVEVMCGHVLQASKLHIDNTAVSVPAPGTGNTKNCHLTLGYDNIRSVQLSKIRRELRDGLVAMTWSWRQSKRIPTEVARQANPHTKQTTINDQIGR